MANARVQRRYYRTPDRSDEASSVRWNTLLELGTAYPTAAGSQSAPAENHGAEKCGAAKRQLRCGKNAAPLLCPLGGRFNWRSSSAKRRFAE